jgi:hypothetical protein
MSVDRFLSRVFVCFFLGVVLLPRLAWGQDVSQALEVLNRWHAQSPKKEKRHLHLILWSPRDREPPENYQDRLQRIMEHIQKFYADEMERLGMGPRSFQLPYRKDGKMLIHLAQGEHPTSFYEVNSGQEVRRDCLRVLAEAGIDGNRETIVMFCNLATWDPEALSFRHQSPYYAGGDSRRGNAWQLDSPELDTLNLSAKEPLIVDGQYGRISLGKHNSIFIGGIAHELGHALGLPHCKETAQEAILGTALMGSGNRTYGDELRGEGKGSFLTLAHALKLASHPMFSGSVKGMNYPVKSDLENLEIRREGKAILVKGRVKANPPVYTVLAYFDPEGGGDYNARTACAVPDKDGWFSLSCDDLVPGKAGELRLTPVHVNGATSGWLSSTPFRYPYRIDEQGIADLSVLTLKSEVEPVIKALQSKQREVAVQEAAKLKGRAAVIVSHLLAPDPEQLPSSNLDLEEASLTSFRASRAQVGWAKPSYNSIPESPYLLLAGSMVFERGIYAHAPAVHEYELAKRWKTFSGKVALSEGKEGSVQFEIRGDNTVLWRSRTVKQGQVIPFSVKVENVENLTLRVHPTNDGPGADWGLWLEPQLKR